MINAANIAICEAFGIDSGACNKVTIELVAGELPVITTHSVVLDADKAAAAIKRYRIELIPPEGE